MTIEVKAGRDTTTMKLGDWYRLVVRALRQRLLIALCTVLVLGLSVAVALVKKDVYEATTEIIVRPQYIPEDFIKATVSQDLSRVVKTLSQQIMSRSRLQKIIEEMNLYPELRARRGMMEAIEAMRQAIRVESWGSDSFRIAYRGQDPLQVRDVTNTLASLYIQENLRSRERVAENITVYLEEELSRAQQDLEQAEADIRRFQEANMGALPSQEQALAGSMNNLMTKYQTLSDQIRSAQHRKLILSGRIKDLALSAGSQEPGRVVLPAAEELNRAQRQLEALLREYTEDHPQVIRTRQLVAELREKAARETAPGQPAVGLATPSASLQAELETVDREIAELITERATVQGRMGEQEQRLTRIPRVAEQFASLQRKYEFAQSAYNDLRSKAEEARRSQQMEERQKGAQFEIVDRAVVPRAPRQPRKPVIVLAGLMAGFMLGLALAFARTFFDPTFREREELRVIPLPVLTVIPRLRDRRDS